MRTRATVAFGAAPLFSSEKAISSATIPMKNWLLGSCITTPMPSVRCRGERSSTSAPSTRTAPSRSPGKKVPASPSIRRRTVDLPSPDLPQMTVHEPYATSSDTPQTRPPAPDDARSCPASSRLVEVAERHVVQNDRLCSAHKAAPSAYTAAEVATTKKAHATSRTENPTWYTDVRPSPISMPRSQPRRRARSKAAASA